MDSVPSEKGSTPKGKKLLPLGINSFFIELILFQKGLGVQGGKLKVNKMAENLQSILYH